MSFCYDKLKGKIKEKFGTQDKFAKVMGISRTTLNLKLNNLSEFTQKEMIKAIFLLGVSGNEISEYFFYLESSEN